MAEKTVQVKNKIKQRAAVKKNAAAKTKGNGANTVTTNRLELLVTVVGRNKAEYYADFIQSFEVNMQAIVLAQGTANAGTLRYLGLTDTDKSVIFSVIQQNRLKEALQGLEEKFNAVKGGKGIAFSIPFTSVIGTLLFGFLSNNKTVVKENK